MNRDDSSWLESAAPNVCALLVVDVQNDFIHAASKSAGPDGARNAGYREMAETRLAPFVAEARTAGVLIVWIQMENSVDSITPANARMKRKMYAAGGSAPAEGRAANASLDDVLERAVCFKGSWGAELYLQPDPADLIIPKTRYSSFIRTSLESDLRTRGIETALIAGVVTNQCVESTARDAYQYDYNAIVISDCVAEQSDEARRATFDNIERSFGWVRSSEAVRAAWLVPARTSAVL